MHARSEDARPSWRRSSDHMSSVRKTRSEGVRLRKIDVDRLDGSVCKRGRSTVSVPRSAHNHNKIGRAIRQCRFAELASNARLLEAARCGNRSETCRKVERADRTLTHPPNGTLELSWL